MKMEPTFMLLVIFGKVVMRLTFYVLPFKLESRDLNIKRMVDGSNCNFNGSLNRNSDAR